MYLPEINWLLAVLSIACVVGFRSTTAIGHAFGVAVVAVMVITTSLTALVMLMVWRTNPWLVALFWAGLTFAEGIYLTSVLYKVRNGMVRQTCLLTGRQFTTGVQAAAVARVPLTQCTVAEMHAAAAPCSPDRMQLSGQGINKEGACLLALPTQTHPADFAQRDKACLTC